MADIVGYLSVFLMVAISGAGLYPDFFTKAGKVKRTVLFIFLVAAAASALYSLHRGNIDHAKDSGRITQLQTSVTQADSRQEASAKEFISGQKQATDIFVAKYGELSQRLSDLQTGIKTAHLQQQADQLRKALKATQDALIVPKAKLTFSLTNTASPTLSQSLPVTDGVVHVSFYILNSGTVDALDGEIALLICGDCAYAKEPSSFVKINGAAENQRNFSFQHILAHSGAPRLEADIKVNASERTIDFGVQIMCRTCETAPAGNPPPNQIAHITLIHAQ